MYIDSVTRNVLLAAKCPGSSVFVRTSKQEDTCAGPGADLSTPIDACRCPEGTVKQLDKCIDKSKCGTSRRV